MKFSNKSKYEYVLLVLLGQSFLLVFITMWRKLDLLVYSSEIILNIVLFIAVGLAVLSIIMIKDLYMMIKREAKFEIQKVKLVEDERLINSLRSQKHDFSNHLQTIYGMVQLGKREKVLEYIKSLNKDLNNLKVSTELNNTCILSSILSSKQVKAEEEGIDFETDIEKGIEAVNLSLNKVFQIVSNLVDNAIDATKEYNSKEKIIRVRGRKEEDNYILSVYNSGPIISVEVERKIFDVGFSTKGDDRGFGLYIIKSLLEEQGGSLEVKSKQGFGTEFTCSFLKEDSSKNKQA